MPGMMPLLQLVNYKKSYDFGAKPVLNIPALVVNNGIYWLQGANGSGKTSFLKSVAGLIPFDGDIMVNGCNIRTQRRAYRKTVNWAEAEPVYPDFLTGNDLVAFYQSTKGGATNDIRALGALLGVDKYLHQKTGSYSSGMAKKLSLLLALIGTPALILLDEPLITLDVPAMAVMQQIMQQYAEKGASFIVSSHQPFHESAGFAPSVLSVNNQTIAIL